MKKTYKLALIDEDIITLINKPINVTLGNRLIEDVEVEFESSGVRITGKEVEHYFSIRSIYEEEWKELEIEPEESYIYESKFLWFKKRRYIQGLTRLKKRELVDEVFTGYRIREVLI